MTSTIAAGFAPFSMTAEEWALRSDLAKLYRLMAHFRMTDLIYTHISVRIPGPEHHFLINRYGVLFEDMLPSTLVRIDCEGRSIDPAEGPEAIVNPAGFVIHSAIHMARPDIGCIIHTHTEAGVAVSAQKHGLLPISQQALKFDGHLAYHDYEGIAVDLDERERLVNDLGTHKAMILRNHGLLAAGRTIPEAFSTVYMLETACRIQIAALAGAGVDGLVIPPAAVRHHTAGQYNGGGGSLDHYEFLWHSALPLIDK